MASDKSELSISLMEYLHSCSASTLQEFELSRLNAVANLEKQMKDILQKMVDEAAKALVARALIEQQRDPIALARTTVIAERASEAFDQPKANCLHSRKLLITKGGSK